MGWTWVYIPMVIFLAFSAVSWQIVKRADTVPATGGADRKAAAAGGAAGSAAAQPEAERQPQSRVLEDARAG